MKSLSIQSKPFAWGALLMPLLFGALFAATINNGSALTGNAFTTIADWFVTMMQSDFLRLICLVMLVASIVTLLMGGGFKMGLMTIVGISFLGLIAPSILTTFTTTLPTPEQIQTLVSGLALNK